jgi:hypothetical protein
MSAAPPFSGRLPVERPDDCVSRTLTGTAASFAAGNIIGALSANWGDVPVVLRDKPLPALLRTGRIMGQYGVTFAAIGLAYTGMDCLAETLREKKDAWNGAIGGAAAGIVLGLRVGRLPVALGAAAAMAATSVIVDKGQHMRGMELYNDTQEPRRVYYPYPARKEPAASE